MRGSRTQLSLRSKLAAGFGATTLLYGLAATFAPGLTAVMFGLPPVSGPASLGLRSSGLRDIISGAGILSSLRMPARLPVWLTMRVASDFGDAMVCWLTARQNGSSRLKRTGTTAFVAGLFGLALLFWRPRAERI